MLIRQHLWSAVICTTGLLMAGCAKPLVSPSQPSPTPIVQQGTSIPEPGPIASVDPVEALIDASTRHFETGERELRLGHLSSAKAEFNRALEVLLESPLGGRTEPRVREHFDRLIERISIYELTALAEGDGFTEQRYESAGIDEILALSTFEVPAASMETREAVAADLLTTGHDIDIPLNAKVLSFVQLFTGRLRSFLEGGLSRGVYYLPMIQSIFRAEGLPLDLAYVPLVESAFRTTAVSRAQARGMWQFMRATGLENGLKHDWYVDERAEPEKATRAAARYLKTLVGMFGGDWHLALASYNGGPGRVQRAVKSAGGVADFWRLTSSERYLPRETRDYVPLILAAIIIARNPVQYGVNIEPIAPLQFDTVTLPFAADLRRIAEWVDTPVKTLQELNPELRRWITPVGDTAYELKVPVGTADMVRAHLELADPDEMASLHWHTVKKGDTLLSVARQLKVSRTDLAEANYLTASARLQVGQRLVIPRAPAPLLAARRDVPAPATESRSVDRAVPASNRAPAASRGQASSVVHHVKRGDTLSSIARLYRTTVDALKSWNRLQTTSIRVGQRLTIYTERATTATH